MPVLTLRLVLSLALGDSSTAWPALYYCHYSTTRTWLGEREIGRGESVCMCVGIVKHCNRSNSLPNFSCRNTPESAMFCESTMCPWNHERERDSPNYVSTTTKAQGRYRVRSTYSQALPLKNMLTHLLNKVENTRAFSFFPLSYHLPHTFYFPHPKITLIF